ncbi:hypothetical protein GQ457_14G015210 [Hibiscus cannabinus]
MTRANPRGPRFDYDPELERTQRRLKKEMHEPKMPARTVRDYLAEDLEGLNPAVTMQISKQSTLNLNHQATSSWTNYVCRSFLAKFSYTNMTDHLRNQITIIFRQEDDEAMHEAWERYRDL